LPLIPACLVVDQILPSPQQLTILTSSHQQSAQCPTCSQPSTRVHSRYQRTLGDLPWQGLPVVLRLQARRFRCLNSACPRQTFAESLADAARPFARRTKRLGALQYQLALALGGEAGTRLAERLAMPSSADTLLRLIARAGRGAEPPPVPRVLAIDDWSWRRGHRYGTILVDLERNAVVDLLPDRQAESLAAWLRRHPGVEIVARDRAGAYADGARQGAPDAVQVTDRWHLLRNLGDAVRAVVDRQHAGIRRVAKQIADETAALVANMPNTAADPVKHTKAEQRSQQAYSRRQARYEEAARLNAAGMSLKRIATVLGAERKTVRRWLRAGGAALWRKPPRLGALGPFHTHLDHRWNEGCHNAAQLWRELVTLGFTGRPGTVRQWTGRRRKSDPPAVHASVLQSVPHEFLSARRIAYLLMSDEELPKAEQGFVARLLVQVPGLVDCVAAAKRLNQVIRRKSKESLDAVLEDAAGTALKGFVASLRRDLSAVQAALDLPWTTSPAEGQINRLKMLKRTMYGRAGFQLLRQRVLHAP
jgi:transposase